LPSAAAGFLAAGDAFRRAPPAIAQDERDAMIAALKPPKRQRPLIAIIGINDATETTDYLMPYGILTRADVADVVTLATRPVRDAVPDAQGRTAGDHRRVRCAAS
jgi:putative intracellular protease/amidase